MKQKSITLEEAIEQINGACYGIPFHEFYKGNNNTVCQEMSTSEIYESIKDSEAILNNEVSYQGYDDYDDYDDYESRNQAKKEYKRARKKLRKHSKKMAEFNYKIKNLWMNTSL